MVGIAAARAVHFRLPVSFFMVKSVVEHGQCISEKTIKQSAVTAVHPFCVKSSRKTDVLSKFVREDCAVYAIMIIGTTISLAGKPKIKAIRIIPSRPISLPKGSKKFAHILRRLVSSYVMFAIHQIIIPAGAATDTARDNTNNVRSNIERIIILTI